MSGLERPTRPVVLQHGWKSLSGQLFLRTQAECGAYMVLLRAGFVKHRYYDRSGELLPRHFTLTPEHSEGAPKGGIFSVTLSVVQRLRVGHPPVRRRSVLWSSDFPPRSFEGSRAIARCAVFAYELYSYSLAAVDTRICKTIRLMILRTIDVANIE